MAGSPGINPLGWLRMKIIDPLILILRRGLEPKQLAFSSALGVTLGVFPICGVTVFLCGIAIALLGSHCHPPTVMIFNFVATPLELSLIVPFLRFGEAITGGSPFPLSSDALKKILTGQASREVLLSILHAIYLCAFSAVVGMVCCSTLHARGPLSAIFAVFQVSDEPVQNLSFG
ncbi:hypothetical protein MLD38_001039 [Melastoma candidum]|uniref:Uncharacterized protein n=1 Tax=Melastoma candidum TaxID=119954 RepID=A0ACB9SDY4_9MYRT|nr:hypothetical protein MLD38_001039 [Melastoma candidum]